MFDLTLTFDNGPEPDVTPHVLDVLARRGVHASFFVLGRKLAEKEGRRLVARAHEEGHWIGNHTWTHAVPLGLMDDPAAAVQEVARTQDELGPLVHPDRLFRPFGGGGNLDSRLLRAEVADHLRQNGYSVVLWNAVPRDWVDPDGWVETALAQCATQAVTAQCATQAVTAQCATQAVTARCATQAVTAQCAGQSWTQLVIHDLPTGAMAHLERFLDRAAEAGARFRQEFNPDCVPMRAGVASPGLAAFVRRPDIAVTS